MSAPALSRFIAPLALLLGAGCSANGGGGAAVPAWGPEDLDEAGGLVVDFADGVTKAEYDRLEADWGIDVEFNSVMGEADGVTLSRAPLAPGVDRDALLARIRTNPRVEAAEPLLRYRASMTPNDPFYKKQWHLQIIRMPDAWESGDGDGAVAAVIDTGIAYEDHGEYRIVPDLKGARFAKGYDFVNDDEHPNDDHGHGTHVAGTIAQVTNNREGVAGVAFKSTLMPLKVLDANGTGNSADIADAIRWSADHGAQVINMSLGGGGRSDVMERAIVHARKKGVVVIAAAGNAARNRVEYPAAYPGVVAVSAVRFDGQLAPYSSWGREIDLAAPGGDKSVDQNGDGEPDGVLQNTIVASDPSKSVYAWFQGTSMATPHVAGVAALLVSAGVRGPEAVERMLFETAEDRGEKGWDEKYGHGIVNAQGALGKAKGFDLFGALVRLAVAILLALLVTRSLAATGVPRFNLSPGFWAMALLAAAGLFFFKLLGLWTLPGAGPVFEALSFPIPDWERWFFGPGRASPLFYSALIPVVLSIVGSRVASLRGVLAGLCVGFAAFMLYAAFTGAPALAWMPFKILALPWLAVNAIVALVLARGLLKKD